MKKQKNNKSWKMTEKQRSKYLYEQRHGAEPRCFKCGSKMDFFDPAYKPDGSMTLEGYCIACGQAIMETYKITNVKGLNPEPED